MGGICRQSPLWFLVPLKLQSREQGEARAPIPYRACMAARIWKQCSLNIVRFRHQSAVTERAQILLSVGLRSCADLLPCILGIQGVALPSWIQAKLLLISSSVDCRKLYTCD